MFVSKNRAVAAITFTLLAFCTYGSLFNISLAYAMEADSFVNVETRRLFTTEEQYKAFKEEITSLTESIILGEARDEKEEKIFREEQELRERKAREEAERKAKAAAMIGTGKTIKTIGIIDTVVKILGHVHPMRAWCNA